MNIYPITDLDYTTAIYAAYVSGRGKSIIKKSTKAFPPKKIITEANEYVNMVRKALLHKQDREKQAYEMFLLTNGKTKEL
jgi:c-di-GMP-related signal transduction protein